MIGEPNPTALMVLQINEISSGWRGIVLHGNIKCCGRMSPQNRNFILINKNIIIKEKAL